MTRNIKFSVLMLTAILILMNNIAAAKPIPIALEKVEASGKVPLKLYAIECGTTRVKGMPASDSDAQQGQEFDVPVTCYLIQHPEGTVMVDAGLPDSVAENKDGVPIMGGASVWLVPRTLQSQLEEIDIEPSSIDYLVISHLHPDHVGNAAYFSNAALLIQEAEYAALSGVAEEMARYGIDASVYDAVKAHQPVTALAGHYDIFGDGSVVLVSAPGHSAGDQIVVVDLPQSGPVILGGDMYNTRQDRENYVVSPYSLNKRQLIKSFVLLDDLLEQTGAQLWLNHDKEQNESIAHAPAFHE